MKKARFTSLLVCALVALGMVAVLGLAACGGGESGGEPEQQAASDPAGGQAVELQVFAANSLEKALPEVQALYTAQYPNITFADTQFKASGDLVEQLNAGGSADVLITASKGTMDDAEALVNPDTRKNMFTNDLVIVAAQDSDVKVESLEDVANIDGKIAIGDAKTVPAGKYANQALNSVGLYTGTEGDDGEYADAIKDKVNLADKVGTAAKYVSTGDCAIGFVYSSDIYRYDGIQTIYTTPADSHKTIQYPGAVLADSANAEVAADFLDFCMTNPDAQQIWANYGFELAAE